MEVVKEEVTMKIVQSTIITLGINQIIELELDLDLLRQSTIYPKTFSVARRTREIPTLLYN